MSYKKNIYQAEIKKYMNKPYAFKFIKEEDGSYFVEIEELSGCFSAGDTIEESMSNIKKAMALWIETALKKGRTIPEPDITKEFSGKILIKMPSQMHKDLIKKIQKQNTSLNQYILYWLNFGLNKTDNKNDSAINTKNLIISENILDVTSLKELLSEDNIDQSTKKGSNDASEIAA